MENQNTTPTEIIELPSKGIFYPEGNPLSSGKIEIKYMTAYHEDLLTNQNYIKQGIVLDKLLQSLIVTKINYDDLLLFDKDALLIGARILGYGGEYSFKWGGEIITVDLSKLENKPIDEQSKGKNEFSFKLPHTGIELKYKMLTVGDEKKIQQELEGFKKLNQNPEMLVRLKHMIISVNGSVDKQNIRDFIEKQFLARDSSAFREHLKKTQPGVDLTFENSLGEKHQIPIGVNFFWPESGL